MPMNFIGTVGQAEDACGGREAGELGIGDAFAAMNLDGRVDDGLEDVWGR